METIGLNEKLFGLHSLRSGGATDAANGVPDRLIDRPIDFKNQGRRKSDQDKDGYVRGQA